MESNIPKRFDLCFDPCNSMAQIVGELKRHVDAVFSLFEPPPLKVEELQGAMHNNVPTLPSGWNREFNGNQMTITSPNGKMLTVGLCDSHGAVAAIKAFKDDADNAPSMDADEVEEHGLPNVAEHGLCPHCETGLDELTHSYDVKMASKFEVIDGDTAHDDDEHDHWVIFQEFGGIYEGISVYHTKEDAEEAFNREIEGYDVAYDSDQEDDEYPLWDESEIRLMNPADEVLRHVCYR